MYQEILKSFITLFVIINPIGNLTVFIGLSKKMNAKRRVKIVNDILFVAAILLFAFLFFGTAIFNFFGIGLDTFQIGGGIILLIIAIMYLLDIHSGIHKHTDISAVPMGTPLLIGPGTITSTLILVNQFGVLITFIAAVFALLGVWLILRFSGQIYRLIGPHWSMVASRIMGLVLAAISVEFIKSGILSVVASV
jgi:multiple antibiotic resistance protein|tara:strand:+ start:447 stop:1028 length:582 start_codon:yes stop_codon:yes gene_type:complete